jgi:hypothetical protein
MSLPEYGAHCGFDWSAASETESFWVTPFEEYTVADTISFELASALAIAVAVASTPSVNETTNAYRRPGVIPRRRCAGR